MAKHQLKQHLDELHSRLKLAGKIDEHGERVCEYTAMLCRLCGLDSDWTALISEAAVYHDVGKAVVPRDILTSPHKLTPEQYEKVKVHPVAGRELVSIFLTDAELDQYEMDYLVKFGMPDYCVPPDHQIDDLRYTFFYLVDIVCHYHHENWNGSGYPHGVANVDIPLPARIVAIVDMFDALTSHRPYRPRVDINEVLQTMVRERGTKLDPQLLDIFVDHASDFISIYEAHETLLQAK